MGSYRLHPLKAHPARLLLLVRADLAHSSISLGDAAEILGTSADEAQQLQAQHLLCTDLRPRSLERSLRELGWVIEVKPLAGAFFLGLGGRAG